VAVKRDHNSGRQGAFEEADLVSGLIRCDQEIQQDSKQVEGLIPGCCVYFALLGWHHWTAPAAEVSASFLVPAASK